MIYNKLNKQKIEGERVMKICVLNADEIRDGILLVSADLGIELCRENADVTVEVIHVNESILSVSLDRNNATIRFGGGRARFFRGLATLVGWMKNGERENQITETPLFDTNGAMVDMSRNAVMKVSSVKAMLRKLALMGMNMFMLYTEDTYEIEGRPYFGYMRGRYTKEELKELDAYAGKLGIEIIPCIQVLGHLATHLQWKAASPYRDTANAMLVGADATYELIDDMIKTVRECFTSRRIHIGMDETHDLGIGAYLAKNGYRERQDIYFDHLERVIKQVRSHGLEPMMWSDMFFRMAGKELPGYGDYDERVEFTDDTIEKVPKGIQQVFWDYYRPRESFYDINLKKHEKVFGKGTVFAGGVWMWSGHCPLYSRSLKNTVPALDACKKNGVREVLATVWHNGSESNLMLALAGLAWYADYDYSGAYEEKRVRKCFENACGVSYDDMMLCELPEYPDGGDICLTRALLYNDPLVGLVDKHIEGLEMGGYYTDLTERLEASKEDKGIFGAAYDVICKLSALLENKADFGVRLKTAYDDDDRERLSDMLDECDTVIEKLKALKRAHKAAWMEYNKPFGWEIHDIRYGGLEARFETVRERLDGYLKGEIDAIEELEAERLFINGPHAEGEPSFDGTFKWIRYARYATANMI